MRRNLPEWVLDDRRALGARIRELRVRANLTQERLAELTGVDRRTLQRIEAGSSDPRLSALTLIAEGLDVPLVRLVAG